MITRCSHDHVIPKYPVTSSSSRHAHVRAHARALACPARRGAESCTQFWGVDSNQQTESLKDFLPLLQKKTKQNKRKKAQKYWKQKQPFSMSNFLSCQRNHDQLHLYLATTAIANIMVYLLLSSKELLILRAWELSCALMHSSHSFLPQADSQDLQILCEELYLHALHSI